MAEKEENKNYGNSGIILVEEILVVAGWTLTRPPEKKSLIL